MSLTTQQGKARRKGAVRGKMLMSAAHSTVNIGPSQACCRMNIKDTFDCLLPLFLLPGVIEF